VAVQLSSEELAILDRYTFEGLDRAMAEADNAVMLAAPAQQEAAMRRYLLIANLEAKLTPSPAPPEPEVLAQQTTDQVQRQAYLQALPAEEAKLAQLTEAERDEQLMLFKMRFFKATPADTKPGTESDDAKP
jgi:hypothetical protein